MISGKNSQQNSENNVIFENQNGKENAKNMSIYRFSVRRNQIVGLKEIDGGDSSLWHVESSHEI